MGLVIPFFVPEAGVTEGVTGFMERVKAKLGNDKVRDNPEARIATIVETVDAVYFIFVF